MDTEGKIVEYAENHLVINIKTMIDNIRPLPVDPCIFRVPYTLRCVNEEAYTPVRLSIGPFHHGKGKLKEMEDHKRRYLRDFLKRRTDLHLEDYVRKLKGLEDKARNCYDEIIAYTSDEFIQMMLFDGCFIVELFLKCSYKELRNKEDPIFKNDVIRNELGRDLILLENQVPFHVLEHLFRLNTEGGKERYTIFSLPEIILKFDLHFLRRLYMKSSICPNHRVKHILDYYLECCTPKQITKVEGYKIVISNATKLHDAGIRFQISDSTNGFLEADFNDGILKIPNLLIDDYSEIFFRNLIALEQCDSGNTRYVSDYIFLMDSLIDSPNDVRLLKKDEIVESLLGHDEQLTQFLNKLCIGVTNRPNFYYGECCSKINAYEKIKWNLWRTRLKRDYFNTPWAIISVIAAITLLVLAFIQSVCSVVQV